MLVDEVRKRTRVHWPIVTSWPEGSVPVVAVGPERELAHFAGPYAQQPAATNGAAEGYRIRVETTGRAAPAVLVIGNDARGVLFGVGRLLRELRMARDDVAVADDVNISAAPKYPLRGHQLGYRPKTNSYDGWDVATWEQYIRDLAVFGTNAVELIPPRSDDAADSPHFPLPPMEMMIRMSKLLDDYGLDVWIWYPAMDRDYSDPKTVDSHSRNGAEVFEKLPRIDAVFVPGGDPGHTRPRFLLNLLEKETAVLHRSHPKAQMWVSPQSFTQEWLNEFVEILDKEQPAWLSGVVFGPQVRISLPRLRELVPKRYPIRRYPDITHSLHCQYPVADWDLAYALTEAREGINPRPEAEAHIFRFYQDAAVGFITYSEGCNDDVNKIVWSSLGWDPNTPVIDILRDYSRYFIGDRYRDDFAQGLLALERNWHGPLLTNESVYETLKQFRTLEKSASPQVRANWRFQQALYRAYFDGYVRMPASLRDGVGGSSQRKTPRGQATRGIAGDEPGGGDSRSGRNGTARRRLAGARLRAGGGAIPEYPHAAQRRTLPSDLGGPGRQSRYDRHALEQPSLAEAAVRRAAPARRGRAAEGHRRHPPLGRPWSRRLLRRSRQPDAPAAPGPRPWLRS